MKRGTPIHEIDQHNDVTFRGVFSYRHFRVLGWFFFALAQVGMILSLFGKQMTDSGLSTASNVLGFFSSLMAPLFLIAAFARVLTAKDGYRRLILLYVGGALGIAAAFYLAFYHYAGGIISAFSGASGSDTLAVWMALFAQEGFFTFNIFIDLALCTLLTFFLNYRPTRFFQGKALYAFRLFALLPILYEVASIVMKILSSTAVFLMPPALYPWLTTKPPVAFLIFIALALFVKLRERHFLKNDKSIEEYQVFLDTNANKRHFSRFLMLIVGIAVALDALLFIAISAIVAHTFSSNPTPEEVARAVSSVNAWGLGNCFAMVFILPFIAFFDYRKTYQNPLPDIIIPAVGVGLVAAIYLEGLFQFACYMIAKIGEGSSDPESSSMESLPLIYPLLRVWKP